MNTATDFDDETVVINNKVYNNKRKCYESISDDDTSDEECVTFVKVANKAKETKKVKKTNSPVIIIQVDSIWKILDIHTVMTYKTLDNLLKNTNIPRSEYDEFIGNVSGVLESGENSSAKYFKFEEDLEKMRELYSK